MPGSLGHEEQDAKTFASWVTFVSFELELLGCVYFAKSRRKVIVASFVVIWQNLSNHRLIRLKRFVPTFTDKLCN
jgi:hypothetical protein